MKNIYLILFFALLLSIAPTLLQAQCNNYTCKMELARNSLKKGEYKSALDHARGAESYDPSKKGEINRFIDEVFAAIEKKKKEAEDGEKKVKIALMEAEAAKKKAIAVLDKIYFYQERFGLAYDKSEFKYGFIDKNLNTKIEFKYDEALPFEELGFAKVKKSNVYYLIDTLGNEYRLATEINQLSPEITALDLRQKELIEIPDIILKSVQLKVLLLSKNNLYTLPAQIGELNNLQFLFLNSNNLFTLPAQIGELKNLKRLDLFQNNLQALPAQIGELKNLESLNLFANQLQTLPDQICELKNLQSLFLGSNNLFTLPVQIGELKNLQSLDLFNFQFLTVPVQIGELKNLQLLNLGRYPNFENQLTTHPEPIFGLKYLKSLNLSNISLETLPAQIGELKNLQSLDLSGNKLQTLPAQIGELKNLQSLNLYGNKLQTLPAQISELKNLQSLKLSSNQLQTLPIKIGELKDLQLLDLSSNKLTKLPEQIGELKNLQDLELSFNTIQTLPVQIGKLQNLQYFGLSYIKLQTLPAQIGELQNLKSLELYNNQLQTLPPQIGELKNLQSLELLNNQFQTLPAEIGELKNLQSLYLQDNQLHTLPTQITALKNLQLLELGGNPLSKTDVSAYRGSMPWCEINWWPPIVKEKPLTPAAIFEKNQWKRGQSETEVIEGEAHLKSNPIDTTYQKVLANTYNSLGWYQLLTGQFSHAEASINRGFQLDSTNIYLPTNRALSLLFQGKTAAALQEYKKWKDLPFGQQKQPFYRDAFLSDLAEFESAGIIPEARRTDVEAVRKLLGVKKE